MAQKPETTEAADQLRKAESHEVASTDNQNTAPALRLGKAAIPDGPTSRQTPVFKTAFGVGDLAEAGHPQGTMVLGDYVLGKKGDKLRIIPVGISFYFKQNTKFIPGVRTDAIKFATAQEVTAAGYSLDWRDGPHGRIQPDFQEAADFILLIEQPDGVVAPYFSLELAEKRYALARYYTDRNVYRFAGEPIVATTQQLDNVFEATYELETKAKTLGKQPTTMPFSTLVGPTDPKVCKAIQEFLETQSTD